jgi:RNA polymerase sigma-70 factor (ECF subfamily)
VNDDVRAAQRGDPVALSVLLEELAGRLGRVCGSIALDRGDDALQETLIVVLRNLNTLRDPEALVAWARRIAVRESLRVVARVRDVPRAELPDVPTDEVDVGTAVDVRRVLASLSPAHRAVLVLRHMEGLSEADVAEVLEVSVGTVKSRASRAREAFMSRWPQ